MRYFLLADRYQVEDVVGRGGMSEVHRGRDRRLSRPVAVKVLRKDLARNPAMQERFRLEAQNAADLNHPNIVAVYDTGDQAEGDLTIPYIVMEFVDGEVLRDVLSRDGPPPPRRALEIVADICVALDFSHRHGVVHRDIRPGNVMLSRSGVVKVMDFGTARVGAGQAATTATAVIGTAHYLAPEQIDGGRVDARSDIYAAGCVLYELLTGTPPFTAPSPVAVAYQHVREVARPPSEVTARLPRALDAVVLKALSKNPLNRYQNATEMRTDLLRALSGQAVSATPVMSEQQRSDLIGARMLVSSAAGPRGAATAGPATGSGVGPPVGPAPAPIAKGPALLAPVQPAARVEPPDIEEHHGSAGTRRGLRMVGLVAVGAAVVVALWLTLMVVLAPPAPAKVSVPDVTGMTLEQAQATLRDKQLVLGAVEQVDSPKAAAGRVVNQRPSELTEVDENTPVNIEIDSS
ncbi:MAG: Stk1 family PASTA domain-containing Ser/Thr kinase [Nakamurella sp.]